MYQPSTARVPSVTTVDAAAIPPSLTDYPVPFHHPPISSISSDLPGLDVLSLFPVDSQQYCPPMFLDSLTSTLTSSTPGSIITSTSHHESSTHVSSSGRAEAGVITSSGGAPDIISLD
nr:E3 SUMO-protein ligase PIAS2-like isoform X1 [Taeniopygia guttata]